MKRIRILAFLLSFMILVSCTLINRSTTTEDLTSTMTTEQTTTTETSTMTTTEQTATTETSTTTTEEQNTTTTEDEWSDYYADAYGKTGDALKSALHNIIDDHTELTYDEVKYALRDTDEDPVNPNNVILFYTGRTQSKNEFGGDVDDWNREHVWAKSHGDFGKTMGAGTDLHHIKPTDASVNNSRGNKDFDYGGSLHNECIILKCKTDSDSWEPDDEVKGDVARMMFYMAVRYEGDSGEVDLELNDSVNNNSAPYIGRISVLLEWHQLDPVSDFEMNRNNIIYEDYQHNRNPFIDHPEWVNLIWNN